MFVESLFISTLQGDCVKLAALPLVQYILFSNCSNIKETFALFCRVLKYKNTTVIYGLVSWSNINSIVSEQNLGIW